MLEELIDTKIKLRADYSPLDLKENDTVIFKGIVSYSLPPYAQVELENGELRDIPTGVLEL